MDFELSPDEAMIRDAVVEFAQKECPPDWVREVDEVIEEMKEIPFRLEYPPLI